MVFVKSNPSLASSSHLSAYIFFIYWVFPVICNEGILLMVSVENELKSPIVTLNFFIRSLLLFATFRWINANIIDITTTKMPILGFNIIIYELIPIHKQIFTTNSLISDVSSSCNFSMSLSKIVSTSPTLYWFQNWISTVLSFLYNFCFVLNTISLPNLKKNTFCK